MNQYYEGRSVFFLIFDQASFDCKYMSVNKNRKYSEITRKMYLPTTTIPFCDHMPCEHVTDNAGISIPSCIKNEVGRKNMDFFSLVLASLDLYFLNGIDIATYLICLVLLKNPPFFIAVLFFHVDV